MPVLIAIFSAVTFIAVYCSGTKDKMRCAGRGKMCCSIRAKVLILMIIGLLLAIIGLTFYILTPRLINKKIKENLTLKPGSQLYELWQKAPIPIYMNIRLFNITNIEEVWAQSHKPILEELGPYTFREEREKVNIAWNDNGTVSYRQIKRWYYQPDRTVGSLDDVVTTINVPMLAAATQASTYNNTFIYYALNNIFNETNSTWFVSKTARELIFEGYNSSLIDGLKNLIDVPYDKFGYFYNKNGTDDGEYAIYTDGEKAGQIYTWNGKQYVDAYVPPCNSIKGSAGDFWPPITNKKQKLTFFISDICRSLALKYTKETNISKIKLNRYIGDNTQFDNGEYDLENKCYCTRKPCLPTGGLNISECKFGAPMVVSYPHFLFADPVYVQSVSGLKPDARLHSTYIDVIPEMGFPARVSGKLQISVIFDRVEGINDFENITHRRYIPTIWFSESAELTEELKDKLNFVFHTLPLICDIISFTLVAIGSLLVIASLVLAILYALGKVGTNYGSISEGFK